MIALIMAGGFGTRFWPLSTEDMPKQYLRLFDDKSMLRLTYERIAKFIKDEDIFIVTVAGQTDLILEHLPELSRSQIIIEPFGMNTAPCIGLSIMSLNKRYDPTETMLVLPADHYIPNNDDFKNAILEGATAANDGKLVTYGIMPTYPATGYGYIEAGAKYKGNMRFVERFKEKPDHETAAEMLARGNFCWNSGMFCWSIQSIIESFKKFCPKIITIAEQVIETNDMSSKSEIYQQMPRLPIDIAIMEKADNSVVLPVSFKWSDVGNWFSLSELMSKDDNGNYAQGKLYSDLSQDNAVFTKKYTALIGVSDIVIVETDDALLVVNKEFAERVKLISDN